ncbi:MAG: histidine phosphatase family protein [Myxococcales bacterium]|nr:MAG: histidine phosphatase family protein [Myxococcales bacterium]
MTSKLPELWLVRHGETEWSKSGQHTGRTDIPLTATGQVMAARIAHALAGRTFGKVLSSPLGRAFETCRLAGLADRAERRDDLLEWNYGDYEGLTTPHIRTTRPGWFIWDDGCPNGESAADVAARVDRVIAEARATPGDVVVFAHGHVLRVLAARWLGLEPGAGRYLALSTATVSVLGYEREQAVVHRWNDGSHLTREA